MYHTFPEELRPKKFGKTLIFFFLLQYYFHLSIRYHYGIATEEHGEWKKAIIHEEILKILDINKSDLSNEEDSIGGNFKDSLGF